MLTPFRPACFFAGVVSATSLLASPVFAQTAQKYRLTYNDEFNSGFNSAKWLSSDYHGIRNNSGDYQAQWFSDPDSAPSGYSAHNPFVSSPDGTLSIQAMPTPAGVYSGLSSWSPNLPYVSGMMSTAHKFTQRYGYFELRAKLPPGAGLWSRFWLLTDDGAWPGEYDVFEILGRDNSPDPKNYFTYQVRQTTHFWDRLSAHGIDGTSYSGINPIDGKFHTYGFLWKPDSVTWYVDGVPTKTQANRINIPMYTILDLAVGTDSNWPGKVDATTPFPAKMEMDYFRIYSNDPSLPSVTPEKGYTPSTFLPAEVVLDPNPAPAPLPEGWTVGDVGKPDIKGSTTWHPVTGEWMLKGAGNTIATSGQCQFARTPLPGDGAVIASVQNVTESAANDVRAGVTIRATADTGSAEVSLLYKASIPWPSLQYTTSLTLQTRNTNGAAMEETIAVPAVATVSDVAPITLGLVRSGNIITAAYSTDGGGKWIPVGSPKPVSMTGTLLAGIAMGGNQNNYQKPARAIFNNVMVGSIIPTITSPASSVVTGGTLAFTASLTHAITAEKLPTDPVTWSVVNGAGTINSSGVYTAPKLVGTGQVTIKAVVNGLPVTRTIAITLPSPWTMPCLTRTPPGDAGFDSGRWTLTGGGAGVSTTGSEDRFRFMPAVVAGNETLTVRVESSAGNQAGLIFRDFTSIGDNSAGRGARYAGIWLTPTGLQWATRETGGKAALMEQAALPAGPVWLRLSRSGVASDVFTASYSADGTAWTQLGSPRTFAMTDPAFAGLAIASGDASKTTTAVFSELSIASRRPGSPTIAVPANCPAKTGPSPTIINGTTAEVAALGADQGGEAALTYTWTATGPESVSFSENGTNAAKSSIANFTKSGSYVLTVTITDSDELTVVSSVSARVK